MSLNVVGLISGGKDSLFSLAHCLLNGHNLVALANLHPESTTTLDLQAEDGEGPDLDSFMYQTVGHSVLPLYEEALGVPLYRRPIRGAAIQNGRYYETSPTMNLTDETEDMYSLIKEIIQHHPEVNALNAGAILSTYQRTRVESVAVRLGLVPLAYLWQYPALPPPSLRKDSLTGLLDDMELSGCDARIIKIASGGIPANLSFSNVADPSTRMKLVSGMTPFFADAGQEFWLRGAVLGEGGEYETLALNGPHPLWKKRIQVDSCEAYEAGGGSIYTRLGQIGLVERNAEQTAGVPTPVLLDERFSVVQSKVNTSDVTNAPPKVPLPTMMPDFPLIGRIDVRSNFAKSCNTVQVFNLTSPGDTAAGQLDTIITTLPFVLSAVANTLNVPESCLAAGNIVSTTLLLRSMEDFASVNKVYTTKLWPPGLPNPPARVTIAASLPRTARVSISLTYNVSAGHQQARQGLHVQSRSYWAPANIGPYSQAICVPVSEHGAADVVHLAGQIPLVPSTMSMLDTSFTSQAVLALQHLWRVAQERGIDQWVGAGVAYLAQPDSNLQDDSNMLQHAREAAQIWKTAYHIDEKGHDIHGKFTSSTRGAVSVADEDEDIDIWDLQQRHRGFGTMAQKMTVGDHLHKLPCLVADVKADGRADLLTDRLLEVPCFIAAEVLGLPRDAPIEWWSTGIAGIVSMSGVQTTRTIAVPIKLERSWNLSGLCIEEVSSEEADGAEHRSTESIREGTPSSKQRNSCFFVTLRVNSTITGEELHLLPHNLQDLIPYLVQDQGNKDSLQWELATAQSFVNLSCPIAASMHAELQLLQDSCVILCNHVWSLGPGHTKVSQMPTDNESTETRASRSAQEESQSQSIDERSEDIREVAAAIIMRIDAVSKE